MKKIDKSLPGFTKGEEIFSAVSHIVGGAFGILALVIGVYYAYFFTDGLGIFSMVVYGVSMIILYTMSAIYHFLKPNKAKRVFRIFDHCTIFLLIAGTYTPICLISLRNSGAWGWTIFIVIWFLAILGVVVNAVNMYRFKGISMLFYLLMGWCIVIAIVPLLKVMPLEGFLWLLGGGIAYTVGSIFFGLGKKIRYIHSIWHLWVLLGTILQFVGIMYYVILPH